MSTLAFVEVGAVGAVNLDLRPVFVEVVELCDRRCLVVETVAERFRLASPVLEVGTALALGARL